MTEMIARPWLWARDIEIRSRRMALFGIFSATADSLVPDDNAPVTSNVLQGRCIYAALNELLKGRDEDAAVRAIVDFCYRIKDDNELSSESERLVDRVKDHCVAAFMQAFQVAKMSEKQLTVEMIDLAALHNVTGVLQ